MGNLSFKQIVIGIVVVLGVIALLYIATGALGVPIPAWLISVFWVILVVVVIVAAIKFLFSLWGG